MLVKGVAFVLSEKANLVDRQVTVMAFAPVQIAELDSGPGWSSEMVLVTG